MRILYWKWVFTYKIVFFFTFLNFNWSSLLWHVRVASTSFMANMPYERGPRRLAKASLSSGSRCHTTFGAVDAVLWLHKGFVSMQRRSKWGIIILPRYSRLLAHFWMCPPGLVFRNGFLVLFCIICCQLAYTKLMPHMCVSIVTAHSLGFEPSWYWWLAFYRYGVSKWKQRVVGRKLWFKRIQRTLYMLLWVEQSKRQRPMMKLMLKRFCCLSKKVRFLLHADRIVIGVAS